MVTSTPTDTATATPTYTPTSTPVPSGPVSITYVYDPLNRLTAADYSTGDYYHYTYDQVGNRMSQEQTVGSQHTSDTYGYDNANRLTNVNGVTYNWDTNGNLRGDGENTYDFDAANRLIGFAGQGLNASFAYNGLGDRLSRMVNRNL